MPALIVRTAALLAMTQLAGCYGHRHVLPPPVDMDLDHTACDTTENSADCARLIEAQQLLTTDDMVSRRGDKICVRLSSGNETCVADEQRSESEVRLFSYLGTLTAPRYHVLWVQYYEGNSILLINAANGRQVPVDAIPIPSPNAKYVAVASADIVAGYNPNRLSIWSVNGDTLQRVWMIEPQDWGPGPVRWVGRSTLRVPRIRLDPKTSEEVTADTVTVELKDRTWRLVESR